MDVNMAAAAAYRASLDTAFHCPNVSWLPCSARPPAAGPATEWLRQRAAVRRRRQIPGRSGEMTPKCG